MEARPWLRSGSVSKGKVGVLWFLQAWLWDGAAATGHVHTFVIVAGSQVAQSSP